MEWLLVNWELIFITLALVANAVGIVYNVVRSFRAGNMGSADAWLCVIEAARAYEKEAEGFTHYSAAEKLEYVLSRLQTFTAELGCSFEEERLIALVNDDIAFSKAVNARGDDHTD